MAVSPAPYHSLEIQFDSHALFNQVNVPSWADCTRGLAAAHVQKEPCEEGVTAYYKHYTYHINICNSQSDPLNSEK
jgi:hypothetical protein